jgi:hypothetical protein
MKKSLLATTVLAVALLGSSSAFAADSTNHSKLSAFQDVKTSAVSANEMNQVSGELAPIFYTAYYYGVTYVIPALTTAVSYCVRSVTCPATVSKIVSRYW